MNKEELKTKLTEAIEQYLEATEAWEDCQLLVDTSTGEIGLIEEEESETLPATADTYFVMDFVRMDASGTWEPDSEAIAQLASDLSAAE